MAAGKRSYLGVEVPRPRVGFFEFTSCEGCQLQLLNDEERLVPFLDLVEIVAFREAMSTTGGPCDIAFIEGSISCEEEIGRLRAIREEANVVVAFGSCACFGGINQLRNRCDLPGALAKSYNSCQLPVTPLPEVLPLAAVIEVDLKIYGCPVHKGEVERIVCDLALGKRAGTIKYPVCMECSARGTICLYELGQICLGPVTRGGCGAWCPGEGAPCLGCRGAAEAANVDRLQQIIGERELSEEEFLDRLAMFGGFRPWLMQRRSDGGGGG